MTRSVAGGSVNTHAPEQIVVDTEHCGVVGKLLGNRGFTVTGKRPDLPGLGLSLICVENLNEAPKRIPGYLALRAELQKEIRADLQGLKVPDEPSDLEVVMKDLRRQASNDYAGWIPSMGKNRDLEVVEGLPHIGVGEGPPTPKGTLALEPRPPVSARPLRVGVLDSGLFQNGELAGRYVTGDFIDAKPPFRTWQGHATFIAGRILRRAPGVELDVRRVLRDENGRASSWDVATMMASFLGSGVEILNMSFGNSPYDGKADFVTERAINALSTEMVLVAAAGNHGREWNDDDKIVLPADYRNLHVSPKSPTYPAALPNVVAVGATNLEGEIADFTPPGVPWVDLVAPGVDVESTYLTGEVITFTLEVKGGKSYTRQESLGIFEGFATWDGSSFAAADVTGEIARIAQTKGWSVRDALQEIRNRAPDGGDDIHRPRW